MLHSFQKTSEKIFGSSSIRTIRRLFQKQRQRIAQKLGNPRLLNITFHTLRHWKATMEYHKTKDILYVMKVLGHKSIRNTLIYTQLIPSNEDDFICKAATTIEEAKQLIEAGFEYVCDMEGVKLFRKRK
ncbi:MAG: site-specific integrase [Candidatus Bathyarchaeia archaeon]